MRFENTPGRMEKFATLDRLLTDDADETFRCRAVAFAHRHLQPYSERLRPHPGKAPARFAFQEIRAQA